YRHSADAKAYAAEQAEQVENRRLSLSRWEDGSYLISGVLDAVGGAALRMALEPLARKLSKDDDRNRERRLADALVEFVERSQPVQLQAHSRDCVAGAPKERCSACAVRRVRRWSSRSQYRRRP
ncbi:MAG TPA: DUF222 domain-containing protein, partial [Candidatus Dormibacteraeota bacterium]